MQTDDFPRFHAVMQGMAKLYERDLDRVLLDVYWLALGSWSLAQFEQAAGHLMATSRFMPRPADFTDLRRASRPTAGEAFARALKHAASSAYRSGPLGDAVIDAAVAALGGYGVIAMSDDEGVRFLERRFAEHYGAIAEVEAVRDALPSVAPRVGGPKSITDLLPRREP